MNLFFSVNDELIYELLYLSEGIALRLINEEGNVEACLRWYELIVGFANRHGTLECVTCYLLILFRIK